MRHRRRRVVQRAGLGRMQRLSRQGLDLKHNAYGLLELDDRLRQFVPLHDRLVLPVVKERRRDFGRHRCDGINMIVQFCILIFSHWVNRLR